jgi:GT2 family glycosyltransferase
VAVVIPARGRADRACRAAEAVRDSRGVGAEVLLVDDASADALEPPAGTSVLRLPRRRGPAAARNAGAARTDAALLAFVDSDVYVRPDALARLARRVLSGEADCASGLYSARPLRPSLAGDYKHAYLRACLPAVSGESFTVSTALMVVSRDAFTRAGGFDEELRQLEDVDLSYRFRKAGFRAVLDREAVADHDRDMGLGELLVTDLARGHQFARLWVRHRAWRLGLAPSEGVGWRFAAAAALFPLAAAAAAFSPAAAAATAVAAYLCGARFLAEGPAGVDGPWRKIAFPALFCVDMLCLGAGACAGAVRGALEGSDAG